MRGDDFEVLDRIALAASEDSGEDGPGGAAVAAREAEEPLLSVMQKGMPERRPDPANGPAFRSSTPADPWAVPGATSKGPEIPARAAAYAAPPAPDHPTAPAEAPPGSTTPTEPTGAEPWIPQMTAASFTPAPAAPARDVTGGVWYRSLPFLCVPQFLYGDGGRGFFIVDLGQQAPDRRLICFEDKGDALKFAEVVQEWDQFREATKAMVEPAQPREMERLGMSRQCRLMVLRKGELVASQGATEADVVRELQAAYDSVNVLA